jgi:hypothetical protein
MRCTQTRWLELGLNDERQLDGDVNKCRSSPLDRCPRFGSPRRGSAGPEPSQATATIQRAANRSSGVASVPSSLLSAEGGQSSRWEASQRHSTTLRGCVGCVGSDPPGMQAQSVPSATDAHTRRRLRSKPLTASNTPGTPRASPSHRARARRRRGGPAGTARRRRARLPGRCGPFRDRRRRRSGLCP